MRLGFYFSHHQTKKRKLRLGEEIKRILKFKDYKPVHETRTHRGKVRKRGEGMEKSNRGRVDKKIQETQIRATYEWLHLPSPPWHHRDMLLRAPGR